MRCTRGRIHDVIVDLREGSETRFALTRDGRTAFLATAPIGSPTRTDLFTATRADRSRTFARADFKLDGQGQPLFLEINPLPTFALDGSFGILAELEGRDHPDLLAEVIGLALGRLGLVEDAA